MTVIQNPSLPKHKIKFLLLEGISDSAVQILTGAGYENVVCLKTALDGDALKAALQGVRVLGIRSRTQMTAEMLAATNSLMAVGCFSVGTNQIDLDAARHKGIPVFNAPFSNTRSVAELTMAEVVMLFRRTFQRSTAAHKGEWQKSAEQSFEVRGKTLGIVGYGNIGTQLSMLAEAMGMRVIFSDHTDKLRHGNVEPVHSLGELLEQSDVVTMHVPDTPATRNMVGAVEIAKMKKGAYFINNARGKVVDLDALASALNSGHLGGAAIDVFPTEPGSNSEAFVSPLQNLENVILTPHVGGSTQEAQERIGEEVARKLVEYSDIGSTVGTVNFPQVQLTSNPSGTRFLQVQRNFPGELGKLNDVFASKKVNIASQYYQTDGEVGYVVLDAEGAVENADAIVAKIRKLPGTIRARRLNRLK
ncbi:MAG: phosphoglycerate dehydrogenase [Rhodospirillales bacterium]|jgi:D-3-phosphoglycerate dehydrogenase|tara:strand:- start:509 stop:1762 length:1254 start_codon:yes stop_codon:yes gene_type:complete